MNTIKVTPEQLLAFRDEKNKEIFMTSKDASRVELSVQASESIVMIASMSVNDGRLSTIREHANKSINVEQLMLESHDFGDSTSWADSTSATYDLIPNAGYKLIITSIQARFPEDVDLSNNNLTFTIYKYVPPYGLIPAAVQPYDSMQSLLLQSNDRWGVIEYTNTNAFTKKMVDVKFRYAGSDDADWSKLTLYSSRGEFIRCSLQTQTPLLDKQGQPLQDPCYAVFNCKRVLDF